MTRRESHICEKWVRLAKKGSAAGDGTMGSLRQPVMGESIAQMFYSVKSRLPSSTAVVNPAASGGQVTLDHSLDSTELWSPSQRCCRVSLAVLCSPAAQLRFASTAPRCSAVAWPRAAAAPLATTPEMQAATATEGAGISWTWQQPWSPSGLPLTGCGLRRILLWDEGTRCSHRVGVCGTVSIPDSTKEAP
jgi:hypothetical protein